MRRFALKLVVAVLATMLPLAANVTTAHADTTADQFLVKINALRSSKGLTQLRTDAALTSFAQQWTDTMAAADKLWHNPDLADAPGTWTKAGENVGVGPDVSALFDAFVASPLHYKNLIDPAFNTVGIGVTVLASGRMYTTHNFEARPASAPAKAVTVASTTSTTAKRVSVTTTTPTTAKPKPAVTTTTTARPVAPRKIVSTPAPATAAVPTPVPGVVAAPAPDSQSTLPVAPAAPARIKFSLEQMRGLEPAL